MGGLKMKLFVFALVILLCGVIFLGSRRVRVYLTPEQEFRRFAKKFDGPLFDHDLRPLAQCYNLPIYKIKRILLDEGFWSERYRDELCSFVYYIKNEEKLLFATEFADIEGKFTFADFRISEGADSFGIYIGGSGRISFANMSIYTP